MKITTAIIELSKRQEIAGDSVWNASQDVYYVCDSR